MKKAEDSRRTQGHAADTACPPGGVSSGESESPNAPTAPAARPFRILFVAMANSVHSARWIGQLRGKGWNLHLFPVNDALPHAQLRDIKLHQFLQPRFEGLDPSVETVGAWPLPRGQYMARSIVRKVAASWSDRAWRLARTIRRVQPDLVHSLEIQGAGYLTLAAKERSGGDFPAWAVSNWGSDISLFGRLAGHAENIKAVLSACDYYGCECHRDAALAPAYGFRGEYLPVLPNGGGFDIEQAQRLRQSGPTSGRRYIILKGYQNWAGRALFGLRALELCADVLKGYRIAVYLAEPDTALAAELVAPRLGVPVEIIRPGCSHEVVLRLHGSARVSVGLSIGDAISTSALEAMLMGSFPIQSDTSCLNEWVRDGETGILVHPEDPEQIAAAIRRALSDDKLVDRAAAENERVAAERLSYAVVRPRVVAAYERIAACARAKNPAGRR